MECIHCACLPHAVFVIFAGIMIDWYDLFILMFIVGSSPKPNQIDLFNAFMGMCVCVFRF